MATSYVDQITGSGETVAYKAPCRVTTTANIALSGLQTIDGVTLAADDRVLVKDQTNAVDNGIWIVSTGVWSRSRDFDSNRDVNEGTQIYVTDGTLNSRTGWAITSSNPINVGATAIVIEQSALVNAAQLEALEASAQAAVGLAETARDNAIIAKDAAEAAAAAVELPAPVASTFLQRNAGNTDYDTKTVSEVRDALDTAPYIPTRIALKALDTIKDTTALLTESGREGVFIWRSGNYSAQVTADTQEGVYVKANAIASSAGAWVRESGWAVFGVTPEIFGAVGDGATVDNTAMQAAATFAATYGVPLVIAGKSHRLTAAISVSAPITIRGAGMAASRLVWDSGNGFTVTSSSPKATTIEDVSFETKAVASGTALTIDYSALISGGVIMPRAETHAKLQRVRIRGATGYTVDGWLNGIVGISLLGLDVDSCRLNGVYTGAYGSMPNSAKGIHFYGSGSPVQLTVSRTFISAWADAIYTADAEGVYLHNNELVTVGRGYQCVNAVAESGLFISDNHMAVIDTAIKIGNMADGSITGNVIYNVADATPLKGVHVQTGCKNLVISDNIFRRLGAVSVLLGIHLEAGQDVLIKPNQFDLGSQTAIQIDSGFTRPIVHKQHYISAASGTPISNSSTTGMFEELKNFTGDLNNVVTDIRMLRQFYFLGSGVTNAPASFSTTTGGIVETMVFDSNTAVQRAIHPNVSSTYYTRRKSSGSWTAWT